MSDAYLDVRRTPDGEVGSMDHDSDLGTKKCQCDDCRDHRNEWSRRHRRREVERKAAATVGLAPDPKELVDAEPARAHVRWLLKSGMLAADIAKAAEAHKNYPVTLVYGRPEEGRLPPKRVRRSLAEAFLRVPLNVKRLPALGLQRRVLALAWIRYGWNAIAAGTTLTYGQIESIALGKRTWVTRNERRQLLSFYRTALLSPGEPGLKMKPTGESAPPWAWGDRIDNPEAKPDLLAQPPERFKAKWAADRRQNREEVSRRSRVNRRIHRGADPLLNPFVSSLIARRRLQALAWMGKNWLEIASGAGVGVRTIADILSGREQTRRTTDEKIQDYYLRVTSGKVTPGSAHNAAVRKGFAPPWAWTEETICDPEAQPDWAAGEAETRRRIRQEDVALECIEAALRQVKVEWAAQEQAEQCWAESQSHEQMRFDDELAAVARRVSCRLEREAAVRSLLPTKQARLVGGQRRLQAMSWMGKPRSTMQREIPCSEETLRTLTNGKRKSLSTGLYDRICRYYERVCQQKVVPNAAHHRAVAEGFAPPWAWTLDTIDDPTAEAAGYAGKMPETAAPDEKSTVVSDPALLLGLQRRLQGLAWLGFTFAAISTGAGVAEHMVYRLISGRAKTVAWDALVAIRRFYEEVCVRPAIHNQTHKEAVEKGYLAPSYWTAATIDDASVTLERVQEQYSKKVEASFEELKRLFAAGATLDQATESLGETRELVRMRAAALGLVFP